LPDAASVWDLFRLRPGATSDSFSSALRILTPGGEQSQFVSGLEVPQSTGRVNGTGGDGEQSSHWKDDIFINRFIGIMDPTLNIGEREQISSHDIAAIDLFGYTINPAMVTNLAPESGTFQAAIDVTSQTLVVSGAATDANSDIVEARLDLVDDLNRVVAQITSPLSNTDGSRIVSFNLQFPNLNQFSAIRRAMLTVADSEDRRSRVVPADVFFDNDPNRPTITVVNRKGKKLIIKGRGFTGGVRVEVNGLVVAPPINIGGSAKKIKIKGTDALLNLNSGPNRIRVISGNIRSDVATLNL
ncbi:MAG TPA: hypothetical protein VNO14_19650, partial [Blastocatellia bacterium]|nr:hypothetical protein [Blastocatellia bacterium]